MYMCLQSYLTKCNLTSYTMCNINIGKNYYKQ